MLSYEAALQEGAFHNNITSVTLDQYPDQTPSSISRRSRIVTTLLDAPDEIVAALDN